MSLQVSVCPRGGGERAWQGGMHGGVGACVVGGVRSGGMRGGGACMAEGHAWQGGGGVHLKGGMHGRGACVAEEGACVPQQILRDTVNERAVRILLECILV